MTRARRKRFFKIGGRLFLVLLLAYLAFYAGVDLTNSRMTIPTFGYKFFVVRTNSMEPVMERGSLALVVKAESNTLKENDIIVVEPRKGVLIGHYLANQFISKDHKLVIKTKPFGAQGNAPMDYWHIHRENFIGRVAFSLPKLGYVIAYFTSKPGLVATAANILLLCAFLYIWDKPVIDGKGTDSAGVGA